MPTLTTEQYTLPLVYTPNPYAAKDPSWEQRHGVEHDIEVVPGALITVIWSNGAGYSQYRVVDNPGSGPYLWVLLEEEEYRPVELQE